MIPNAICVHEEDDGVLWRHRGPLRRADRGPPLTVASSSATGATLGNYDYGFFWYFYQDGSIEVEVKLTGIPVASAHEPGVGPTARRARAPGTSSAPHHQHLFCFRLDLDVDGGANVVEEVDLVADAIGPANPHGTASTPATTVVDAESVVGARRRPARRSDLAGAQPRRSATPYGEPVGYARAAGRATAAAGRPGQLAVARRAALRPPPPLGHPHDDAELHAAGDYPNQHPGGDGLPA